MRNLLIALALIIPSTAFADPCTGLPPWKRPAEYNRPILIDGTEDTDKHIVMPMQY